MTKAWWSGPARHGLASLLGCASARTRFPDLEFADPSAEQIAARLGLPSGLFTDDELRLRVLLSMTLDVVLEHQLALRGDLTVVHLGGGLSTRPQRLRGLARWWFDVDEPAQAELKRALFGRWAGYTSLACDLGDTSWVDVLGDTGALLLVSESGLMEASEGDFHAILDAITHRLPRGTELLFAYDQRHPILAATEGASMQVERCAGQRLRIGYPRLRFLPRAVHHEDIQTALEGIHELHLLHQGRFPTIAYLELR